MAEEVVTDAVDIDPPPAPEGDDEVDDAEPPPPPPSESDELFAERQVVLAATLEQLKKEIASVEAEQASRQGLHDTERAVWEEKEQVWKAKLEEAAKKHEAAVEQAAGRAAEQAQREMVDKELEDKKAETPKELAVVFNTRDSKPTTIAVTPTMTLAAVHEQLVADNLLPPRHSYVSNKLHIKPELYGIILARLLIPTLTVEQLEEEEVPAQETEEEPQAGGADSETAKTAATEKTQRTGKKKKKPKKGFSRPTLKRPKSIVDASAPTGPKEDPPTAPTEPTEEDPPTEPSQTPSNFSARAKLLFKGKNSGKNPTSPTNADAPPALVFQ